MNLKEPKNPNYSATVVALSNFVDLPNCDNVKAALLFGNSVIVGKSSAAGELGLFFPVETALSAGFLGNNNQFRKAEFGNVDPDPAKKGFFEQHGRVKAMKFRGHKSEGFWIPIVSLTYTGIPLASFEPGMVFDELGDHPICCKYVPRGNKATGTVVSRGRQPRLEDQFVPNQFRFHFDTENLRRNIYKILPDQWISISDKWHGTSAVLANVLIQRPLKWYERVLQYFGLGIQDQGYGFAYSSRRVVKAVNGQTKASNHFYSEDIWGIVAKEAEERIPKCFTLYGEIVGYMPDGGAIQTGYGYGCQVGSHRLLVYRVTFTNPDGQVIELSFPQMSEFCLKYGLETVKELWYGKASQLFPELDIVNLTDWQEAFLLKLEDKYVRDEMCPYNEGKVPAEGIVLRIDRLSECESFKLKNFRFLEAESKLLDQGELDVETAQSEEETAA